jgi:hypothetical protein
MARSVHAFFRASVRYEIRASFDGMGLKNKKIGFAAPQYTERAPKPNWGWNSPDYYGMAKYLNYVIAMTYDSGLKDETKYQPWMAEQTTHILQSLLQRRAASGGQRQPSLKRIEIGENVRPGALATEVGDAVGTTLEPITGRSKFHA